MTGGWQRPTIQNVFKEIPSHRVADNVPNFAVGLSITLAVVSQTKLSTNNNDILLQCFDLRISLNQTTYIF